MASVPSSPTAGSHQRKASSEPNLYEHATSQRPGSIDAAAAAANGLSTSVDPPHDHASPLHTVLPVAVPSPMIAQPTDSPAIQPTPTLQHLGQPAWPQGHALRTDSGWRYWWRRTSRFLGFGRGNEARKEVVSLIFTLCWGTAQILAIVLLLIAGALPSVSPYVNEWGQDVCNRPLGAWAVVWCLRVAVGFFPAIVQYRQRSRAATNQAVAEPDPVPELQPAAAEHAPTAAPGVATSTAVTQNSSITRVATRVGSFVSFFSIVWFIVAHVLLYTTLDTCNKRAPHLWWACFAIVCIGYIVILEVFLVGTAVFILLPMIFLMVNIVLVCLGRPPIRMGGTIHNEVPKLSQRVVDKIPLVLYIPPPPEDFPDAALAHKYPPTRTPTMASTASGKGMFRFLKRKRRQVKRKASEKGIDGGSAWEDSWEKGDFPFVRLPENRATCAICLMDFEPPRKITPSIINAPASAAQPGVPSDSDPGLITVEDALATDPDGLLRLEDAGEGVQPLRLLECGHVFHKTCIDPWLLQSSGRCPHCQLAVLPEHRELQRRTRGANNV
ncbi:hypothetical protein BKA62DRAFT_6365 [Auriculariales sp. MPI-PUGE-AT-0066]|nr:hypothetical protein BKA62DRAFT_6365 [Auriculariales sp. MPI-PUGE-AT-0066]